MKIAIVSASHRKNSRSREIATWVESRLGEANLESIMFDLSEVDMPFWNENFWNPDSADYKSWESYRTDLKSCVGVVLISPEWAGMIPPKLTNFLLLCSGQELAYKPALLVGVSAGISGTYPIAHLRMTGGKNNQMIFLPDHLIVRNAGTKDYLERLEPRLRFNIQVLKLMASQLIPLRESVDLKAYPYGM